MNHPPFTGLTDLGVSWSLQGFVMTNAYEVFFILIKLCFNFVALSIQSWDAKASTMLVLIFW